MELIPTGRGKKRMNQKYNIYCDESCHLENDRIPVMVIGAIWCSLDKRQSIANTLREIKRRHGFSNRFEIKWTKVSPGGFKFYEEVVNYFFSEEDLHFRSLIVPDKTIINHPRFNQDHDTWYYKMFFNLLKTILNPDDQYHIYLDIKDTRSQNKINKLHDVLSNNAYEFGRKDIIKKIQQVRSDEVEQIQLADLLIGAVTYANRGLTTNSAKIDLIDLVKSKTGYSLTKSTLYQEEKFNIFRWKATVTINE